MPRSLPPTSALARWPLAVHAQAVPPPARQATPPATQPPTDGAAPMPAAPPPAPPAPQAKPPQSPFMDTRLSFACAHEDMLRDPRVLPSAPGFHCGRPNALGVLFFDNYDTRFSGFETLTHLALYKHWRQDPWEIEGGVVIR